MAANLIFVTDEQWKVLEPILDELDEGGIIVPPEHAKKLSEVAGTPIEDAEPFHDSYDYGGQANLWIDVADGGILYMTNDDIKKKFQSDNLSYAVDAVLESLGMEQEK